MIDSTVEALATERTPSPWRRTSFTNSKRTHGLKPLSSESEGVSCFYEDPQNRLCTQILLNSSSLPTTNLPDLRSNQAASSQRITVDICASWLIKRCRRDSAFISDTVIAWIYDVRLEIPCGIGAARFERRCDVLHTSAAVVVHYALCHSNEPCCRAS